MSTYDYRDPGTDPAYCEGLAAEDEQPIYCEYCSTEVDADVCDMAHAPFCSAVCAINAQAEDDERNCAWTSIYLLTNAFLARIQHLRKRRLSAVKCSR